VVAQSLDNDKSPADDKVTIRDRDTMQQIRVELSSVETVMAKLMAGGWAEVAGECGLFKD